MPGENEVTSVPEARCLKAVVSNRRPRGRRRRGQLDL